MGFITKSYLQKQFENLAARISSVFVKKTEMPANMTGASTSAAGKAGLVPAPAAGAATRYLRSDGTWQVPPDTNTTYSTATQSANGLMTASDKKKLDGIETGAEVNVQSNWSETDSSSAAYIKNKPTIPSAVAVKGDAESNYRTGNVNLTKANIGLGNVPNVSTNDQTPNFTQASTRANIASGEKLSVILGKIMKFFSDLKTVAFSGSYSDLSNKPSTATTSADGFMSSADKSKLDGITDGANSVAVSRNLTSGTKVGTITIDGITYDLYAPTNTDTKNTAGATDSSAKLFLVGATSQSANPQTYSQDTAYVGTDGCLYSGGKKTVTTGEISSSAAITTQGAYALDAREKNASIDGTLANELSKVNSNLSFALPKYQYEYKYTDIITMFNDANALIKVYCLSGSSALGKEWYGNETLEINATILVIKFNSVRNFAIGTVPQSNELFFTSHHSSLGNPKWNKVAVKTTE